MWVEAQNTCFKVTLCRVQSCLESNSGVLTGALLAARECLFSSFKCVRVRNRILCPWSNLSDKVLGVFSLVKHCGATD